MADPYVRLTDYPGTPHIQAAINLIAGSLTDDLLSSEWQLRKQARAASGKYVDRTFGHCYVATEVLAHWMSPWTHVTPMSMRLPDNGGTHWYLRWEPEWAIEASPIEACVYLDPTRDQLDEPVDYSTGTGRGFLTKKLSRRAQVLAGAVIPWFPAPPRM
jgi:hypothetical protein